MMLYYQELSFRIQTNPDVKRTFNSYKAHMETSVSIKCRVRCPTTSDHSENFRVINNYKLKYL